MVAYFDNSKALSRNNTMWNLPESWFKLNFDGSTTMGSSIVGGVLRNSTRKMVMTYLGN